MLCPHPRRFVQPSPPCATQPRRRTVRSREVYSRRGIQYNPASANCLVGAGLRPAPTHVIPAPAAVCTALTALCGDFTHTLFLHFYALYPIPTEPQHHCDPPGVHVQ